MDKELHDLMDKMFRYGMLFGERVILNTVIPYLNEMQEHPEILPDAIKNITAVLKSVEEEYAAYKAEAKDYLMEQYGEEVEDAEQQRQGEEV